MDKLRQWHERQRERQFEGEALSTDARLRETGGKRKGRRMARPRKLTQVEAIKTDRLAELVETYGEVTATISRRGRKRYATLVTYFDESRKGG